MKRLGYYHFGIPSMTKRALYLCYFGLGEPLVQTQVLPYLRELTRGGFRITLLTFEPELKGAWVDEWRERLESEGIEWRALRYHKRPSLPATLYDILAGTLLAARMVRKERIGILHARSHVGAMIGTLAKKLTGARLLFDIRGLLPEEYVDSGNWAADGFLFRLTKATERWLFKATDGFVVLTETARASLFPNGAGGRPIEVIPCCVTSERFVQRDDRDAVREELGATGRKVFVYAGALGGTYPVRELAELIAYARTADPRVFALILTQSPQAAILGELSRLGFGRDDYRVLRVAASAVPRYLGASDVATLLMRPSSARIAVSPTKFAEYLAAGLPVISTAGIGDLDRHIEEGRVGVLLRTLDAEGYGAAVRAMDELRGATDLAARCRREARLHYDIETVGGPRYRRIYEHVEGHASGLEFLFSHGKEGQRGHRDAGGDHPAQPEKRAEVRNGVDQRNR